MIPADFFPLAPAFARAASWLEGAAVVAYALVQCALLAYSSHRYSILLRLPRGSAARPTPPPPEQWPSVTVQLPLYNERRVVERLVDAVAALDYPRDRLEIQVLDDSTDETGVLAGRAVARHAARGVPIRHLPREQRVGWKAGALAAGLAATRSDLIAVFDADFVPPPDFLRRMAPHFGDPRVGMAQARWGHLNRADSALTRAQAVMLDAHFLLEHEVRMRGRLFFNFNGTAGVWRRACIEDAGGWSHATLTEDLDLSYRAQLKGWRFVFDQDVVAPAELPDDMEAFKSQQRRWAKGSIQTARRLLPAVWASALPLPVKVEAFFHLTSNVAYPLLLALGLLLMPVLLAHAALSPAARWMLQAGVGVLGVVPVSLFLARGSRAAGTPWRRVPLDVAVALVLGVGLSINNARAVLEGLGKRVGDWERTPKRGGRTPAGPRRLAAPRLYPPPRALAGLSELVLGIYFAALLPFAAAIHQQRALPFVALLALGFASVGWMSLAACRPREGGASPAREERDGSGSAARAGRSCSSACP